jgi:hypothetical protein
VTSIVNILDVVGIVSYLIGQSSLNAEQQQIADFNLDGEVTIQDLILLINGIIE